MSSAYDLATFGRPRPVAHPTAIKHEGLAFNALPPVARQALVRALDAPAALPVRAYPGARGRDVKLLAVAAGSLLASLVLFIVLIVAQRVPWVLPWTPIHALLLAPALHAGLTLYRRRRTTPRLPYQNASAFLITARDLVWVDEDRLTVMPFDPERLYAREVTDAAPGRPAATYVVLQLGPRHDPADPTIAGGGTREEALAALAAIQQDLRAKQAAVDGALARGDLGTATAYDPLCEVQGRLAQLAQASRDYGPPAAQGPATVVYPAAPPAWLARAGALVGVAALLGGCCLSTTIKFACDQLLYLTAATSNDHATYRRYDERGWLARDENRARWEALCREVLAERERAAPPERARHKVWQQFLADFPGSPLQAELEAKVEEATRR